MTMNFATATIRIGLAALTLCACGDDGTPATTQGDSSGTAGTGPGSTGPGTMTTDPTMTTQGDASASGDSTTMTPADGSGSTADGDTTAAGSGSTTDASGSTADGSGSGSSEGSSSEGGSSSESSTGGGPCCDGEKAPLCIEGVSCCADGTWACNEGAGQTTCPGGALGEVCGGCAIQGESCVDTDCCGQLECCSGQPFPPGVSVCFAGPCPISDRNRKRELDPVDPVAVLETVAQLPISTWSYTFEPGDVRHMGPMAQDFAAAFGLGSTDKAIFTVDADGVALAAIQALHGELERVQAEKAALEDRVGDLESRLAAIEASTR
jgi:hypothetical protein